ncbi:MAG TPA: sigma-70 family RNA polymerase sigma factor [Sphingomicrobium sp.]|nr:sigma-70 family RNA polymerase sigma factor [Sphingomicrobium sp.]
MVRNKGAGPLDEYLVASARLGEAKAFALLAERWQGRLLAHAWRLTGDGEMAREAAQSAWVDIVRGLHRLQDERAFAAWAYRVVSRRCAGRIGSAVRDRQIADSLSRLPPQTSEVEGYGDRQRLRAAIAALPPDQKSAIALFYLEEMSVAEVAVARCARRHGQDPIDARPAQVARRTG